MMNRKERRAQGRKNYEAHKKRQKLAQKLYEDMLADLKQFEGQMPTPELQQTITDKIVKHLDGIKRRTGFSLERKTQTGDAVPTDGQVFPQDTLSQDDLPVSG